MRLERWIRPNNVWRVMNGIGLLLRHHVEQINGRTWKWKVTMTNQTLNTTHTRQSLSEMQNQNISCPVSGNTIHASKWHLLKLRRSFMKEDSCPRSKFKNKCTIQPDRYYRLLIKIIHFYRFISRVTYQESNQECTAFSVVDRNIVSILQLLFHDKNATSSIFETASEKMRTDKYKVVIKVDKTLIGEHKTRFSASINNEFAIVRVRNEFDRRDIIIAKRGNTLQRISETHRSYDPLQYPLIFWE